MTLDHDIQHIIDRTDFREREQRERATLDLTALLVQAIRDVVTELQGVRGELR